MTWGLVAVAGVSLVSGMSAANSANKAASKNEKTGLQNEQQAWLENISTNRAVDEANLESTIRTGYKVGLLNVQRGAAKREMIEKGIGLSRMKKQVLGASVANAAASGTIGSSVDAVMLDVERAAAEAAESLDYDYHTEQQNFDTELHDILLQGIDALQSPDKQSVRRTPEAEQVGFGEVLAGAAVKTGSAWASSRISLGLGDAKPPSNANLPNGF